MNWHIVRIAVTHSRTLAQNKLKSRKEKVNRETRLMRFQLSCRRYILMISRMAFRLLSYSGCFPLRLDYLSK